MDPNRFITLRWTIVSHTVHEVSGRNLGRDMLVTWFIEAISQDMRSLSDRETRNPPLGVRAATGNRLRSYWKAYQTERPPGRARKCQVANSARFSPGSQPELMPRRASSKIFVAPETCPSENN